MQKSNLTNDEEEYYLHKWIEATRKMNTLELIGAADFGRTEFYLVREIIAETEKGKKIISSELARRLDLTRSAISQIVTKLEEKKIVKRVDSEFDRKIAFIELTDEAKGMFDSHVEESKKRINTIVEAFGKEKLDTLISLFDEFANTIQNVIN